MMTPGILVSAPQLAQTKHCYANTTLANLMCLRVHACVCIFCHPPASGPSSNPVKSYEKGLMPSGCMCDCEVYLPIVHFGKEQISQNLPAAVELVEIVPHSAIL